MKKKELKIYGIIFGIIATYFILKMLISSMSDMFAINIFKGMIIIISSILSFILIYTVNKEKEVHNKFFKVAIFFGMILVIIIPAFHGIDEGPHFFKVYSIFNKVETVQDDELGLLYKVPKDIYVADNANNYIDELKLFNQKSDNKFVLSNDYLGINLYSVLAYITYLLPMFICQKILNLGIMPTIFIGRAFSFIIWLLISTYTIKIIPKRKEFMAFLCLIPINLATVTTYTGDLVTNAVILLFIAYWYRLYYEKRLIKTSEIIVITILGILSACAKIVYTLIFFIFMFLPKENFKSNKHKIFVNLFIFTCLIITTLINLSIVGNDLLNAYPKIEEQKQWILNNIFEYIFTLFISILYFLNKYIYQFTTGYTEMAHRMVPVSYIYCVLYLSILIMSLFTEEIKNEFSKKFKYSIIFIIILIIFIIFTSLYLQFTATRYGVGSDLIYGVQGRYFFPIVALATLINTKEYTNLIKKYLWNGVIIINFIILLKILLFF